MTQKFEITQNPMSFLCNTKYKPLLLDNIPEKYSQQFDFELNDDISKNNYGCHLYNIDKKQALKWFMESHIIQSHYNIAYFYISKLIKHTSQIKRIVNIYFSKSYTSLQLKIYNEFVLLYKEAEKYCLMCRDKDPECNIVKWNGLLAFNNMEYSFILGGRDIIDGKNSKEELLSISNNPQSLYISGMYYEKLGFLAKTDKEKYTAWRRSLTLYKLSDCPYAKEKVCDLDNVLMIAGRLGRY